MAGFNDANCGLGGGEGVGVVSAVGAVGEEKTHCFLSFGFSLEELWGRLVWRMEGRS